MLRKAVCALAVMVFTFSFAMAENFFGVIKKVDGSKITLAKFDRKTKTTGEDQVLTAVKGVKVTTGGKWNKEEKKIEGAEDVKGGLASKTFQNIGEKGIRARISTNDAGEVTSVYVMKFRKKKNNN